MGVFNDNVRGGRVPGPLRRSFTSEKWNAAFARAATKDEVDSSTYEAGLAVGEKLDAIRAILKLSSSQKITATTKLRAFVAISNYDFFIARDKTKAALAEFQERRKAMSDERYAIEEMAAIKLTLPGGFNWKPDEVVEGLVDGIELPIKVVLQGRPSLAGNPSMNKVEWAEAALELNLGVLYRFTEDIWDDCLWNGYRMLDQGGVKHFVPRDIDVLRGYRIGLARRSSLATSFNIMSSQFQREQLAKGGHFLIRDVSAIERRGKRQTIKIARKGLCSQVMQHMQVLRAHASEPYYESLLNDRLPLLNGLSLSILLDAWTVLSCTASVMLKGIGQKHEQVIGDNRVRVWMPGYVPTLQVEALADALETAAAIKKPDGRRVIEFFTYRGEPGQEIWAQPLVPVGSETVAPVFAAIVSPNLRRLVDVWMRQANLDLERRGPVFEQHIRDVVAEAIAGSKILSKVSMCLAADYTFRPLKGRAEQIDLVFSIGNTVFLGEAKCILEPTEAKGIALHRKTVLGAAGQIARKAAAVENNRADFVADMARAGIKLSDDFKIHSLVIISTATHVGLAAMGIPVVDEFILGRYLAGELEDVAFQPSDPSSSKVFETVFYSTATEAEERAPAYFARPQQMQRFLAGVKGRVVPVPAASAEDWSGFFHTVECVAGGVPIALQQEPELDCETALGATAPT
ncbi:hypothetical protein ORK51_00845 [Stenotrophomonas rhizophila]|uniref:hypothetical protein n=1 Tax=Stenotrophomonas rhizophila TaxID=216778 RepID=UPI00224A7571|nr:hypothetical protein [Stenotrophomonas rhizophila]MCX2918730.1 hypothetical protein [Stenotrophomonas rhizophila]